MMRRRYGSGSATGRSDTWPMDRAVRGKGIDARADDHEMVIENAMMEYGHAVHVLSLRTQCTSLGGQNPK